jgi:hypothetical protein
MDRFLVVSPHTAKDCSEALKQLLYTGYITHFDWGCMDGEHTGWAIIEAENAKEATMVVPPVQRIHAKAIKLNKFSPADIKSMH